MGASAGDRPTALTLDAEHALGLARVAPEEARRLARAALRRAKNDQDLEALAVAERALGEVADELTDIPRARAHLERSIQVALSANLVTRAEQARMDLAVVLLYAGQSDDALRQADLAATVLEGADAARLHMYRSLILHRLGRLDEALEGYRCALSLTRRAGDADGEAKLLINRAVLRAYRAEFSAAQADLRRAEQKLARGGQLLLLAKVHHNLGFVAGRRGDVPAALNWFDQAEREANRLGVPQAILLLDRCETLLAARLVDEAREVGQRAARELQAGGMKADLAEARLLLAQAALVAGDLAEARQLATLARRSFLHQRRPGWAALARYASLRAAWLQGDSSQRALLAAYDTVHELTQARWAGPALDARLIAARIALQRGRVDEAEVELHKASRARRSGPADLRARAWHAEALLRHARGDRRGTEAALRAGVRVLARHQATLGATELRVHAAAHAEDLADLGIRVALESGQARRVLAWAERWRAGALLMRPVRPPADAEVADHLTELRHLVSQVEAAGFAAEDTSRLLRRQAVLEEEIRRKARHAHGDHGGRGDAAPTIAELVAGLGDDALVELVECGKQLHAVTLARGRARLHHLGAVDQVEVEMAALRFALGRLARRRGSAASRAAAIESLHHAIGRLDELLISPLAASIGDRALVVVPTGALHALPWSTLPSCRGRAVSVCPSAVLWLRAATSQPPRAGNGSILVAGPGLPHAAAEVSDLAAVYPRGNSLQGSDATTAKVAQAVDGAGLLHVAAHGTFRADNPLFSSLRLADGPLTVYDLEALAEAPRRVVLSACDVGLSAVRPGAELMGFSSALFSLGSQTLVASVVSVPDATTRPLMVEVHRRLARGTRPAEALAGAQASLSGDGAEALASTGGFVCFGAG